MNRREILKLSSATAFASLIASHAFLEAQESPQTRAVHQYDIFEVVLKGPANGNPFVDVQVSATFSPGHRSVSVDGFYDGDDAYKIRFMPEAVGEWSYGTASTTAVLNGKTGNFSRVAAERGNHEPVSVANVHHFAHADGVCSSIASSW